METMKDLQDYITKFALEQGALAVGYTKIRQEEPVMVIGFPFSTKWVLNHPFYITKRFGEEVWRSWNLLQKIAGVLKGEGYLVELKTPLSVFGDFRPLAIAAGLGHWGKNGLVVHLQYGSKLLFASIFTNAPLEVHSPNPSIDAYNGSCNNCTLCFEACPGKAFTNNRFHKGRCFSKAIRGCSECLQVCSGSPRA